MKKKILHIHTDLKFLKLDSFFERTEWIKNDYLIIVKREDDIPESILENVKYVYFDNEYEKIGKLATEYHMIILHSLDKTKEEILPFVYGKSIIGWRFFGLELYSLFPSDFYSELTKKYFRKKQYAIILRKIKTFINNPLLIFNKFNKSRKITSQINNCFEQIDYFFCIIPEEYQYFKKKFSLLPRLIKMPFPLKIESGNYKEKNNQIIIGHNSLTFSNHFDILEILKQTKCGNISYIFPLSYNSNDEMYKKDVIDAINKLNVTKTVLNEMLSFGSYQKIFQESSAFVLNTYRQMGLGNIILALQYHTKIYLPRGSMVQKWLRKESILTFDVEDLLNDINNNKIKLTAEEAEHNYFVSQKMYKYGFNEFSSGLGEALQYNLYKKNNEISDG